MILISKKKKKAAIFFIIIILIIGVGFLFNMDNNGPATNLGDILSGEITYVDKNSESLKILVEQPDNLKGNELLIKTNSETEYGAVPGGSLSQLKEDGYAIISFSELQKSDPVEIIIDAGDGSDLVAKRINLESEVNIEHVQGAQYGTSDLGGRILEKVEDGLIIEAGVPSQVLSEVTKIKTTPKTKYRKFTPLEGVFGDDFTDDDLPVISYDDLSIGDVILAYTELHRVAPNVKAGNYNIADAIRLHPDGDWWPEEPIGFWADNYFGKVLSVDSGKRRIRFNIMYSTHYADDAITLNLENTSFFSFEGDSDEFKSFFEGKNQDKIDQIEFSQIKEGDFINVNIGKDRHTSDYTEDSIISTKEVISGPEF